MRDISWINILILIQFLSLNISYSQETEVLVSEDFAIRDFVIAEDSIYYIKKRNACFFQRKTNVTETLFIGGYGLKISYNPITDKLITVSNELVDAVSSVRFYDKNKSAFEFEFYYKDGKIIDFLDIPEASTFVLSLTNNKIIFFDYKDQPEHVKTIEIPLNSLSRKIIDKNGILYFITDEGKIYKYNYHNYSKTLLYNAKAMITEFLINKDEIIYTTIDGYIFKVDLNTNNLHKIALDNNFISAMELVDNNLICGSWNGKVYVIDMASFLIKKELEIHKRAILKIKKDEQNNLYTSGLDKTIKRWKL